MTNCNKYLYCFGSLPLGCWVSGVRLPIKDDWQPMRELDYFCHFTHLPVNISCWIVLCILVANSAYLKAKKNKICTAFYSVETEGHVHIMLMPIVQCVTVLLWSPVYCQITLHLVTKFAEQCRLYGEKHCCFVEFVFTLVFKTL